jgi:hypothetical protein
MLKLSYAERDITPENPVDLCGFTLRASGSAGVHDRLKIRWLGLLDDRGQKVLLGSADLIGLSAKSYRSLRHQISGGPQKGFAVGIATTHTHSGPATVKLLHCGQTDKAYVSAIKEDITASGREAASSKGREVKMVWGSGVSDVAVNRRSGDKGPIDREVMVIAFLNAKTGVPIASIVNFPCHPVVLGHESISVSADYPGYLTKYMEAQMGAPCLFLNGACGDVNPRNDKSIEAAEAGKTGEAVAKVAMNVLRTALPVAGDRLSWHNCLVLLPVRVPDSARDFEDRLDMLQERFGIARSLFADRVARDSRRLAEGTYPQTVSLELSLLSIGEELGILFVPGELFSSIGLRIKEMALPRKLLVSGFSNGSVGYLPDRQAYKDGGYEPYFANFFYDFPEFDISVEDVILDGAASLLARAGRRGN